MLIIRYRIIPIWTELFDQSELFKKFKFICLLNDDYEMKRWLNLKFTIDLKSDI